MHTIVIGAGSAGAVIAARLTEADHEVTLLEAGPDYPPGTALPDNLSDGKHNSMRAHDWGYRHRPTREQTVPFDFPRGRVVGGSSAVNTCIAVRGEPSDYDEWASLGLREWAFERCLPAFIRLENDLDFASSVHGQSGPLPIRRHPPEELVPWQAAFVEACVRLGHRRCADVNDPAAPGGVGPHAMNKIDGRRVSVAEAYLTKVVRARPGLRVLPGIHVARIVLANGRFSGVEIERVNRPGAREILRGDRVVLSAGAVGSVGILLRSGIGPRAELARLGVECVVDSPSVGRRLLDHPGVAVFFAPRSGVSRATDPLIQTMVRYTSRSSGHALDMHTQPGSNVPLAGITFPIVTLMTSMGKPRGHGRIQFPSADTRARPRIESGFLEDPVDLEQAVEAVERMWEIARTPPLRDMAFPLFPQRRSYRSREAIRAHVPFACGSGYHPCGTIPMSAEHIEEGAVDGRGRVRGVEGVHVADASIMPTIPSANTNLPTIMIGERIAEWLR